MTWSARLVEQDGTVVVADLDGVTVGPIRWVLNRPTTGSITVPTVTDGLDELVSPDGVTVREVQIFRGSDLVLWGFPVGVDWGPATTTVQLADPLWLLGRRYVGRLEDVNLLQNGSFEAGDFRNWQVGSVDTPSVDLSVNALDGSYVARLESGNPPSVNKAATQDFTVGTLTEPTVYIATGYVWVDGLTAFGQTEYELGLVCQLFNAVGVLIDEWWQKVDDRTDRTNWTRLSVPITVPKHTGNYTLRVALASPEGVLFWDAIRLVKVERLSYIGTDQTAIAEGLVEHAQDTAYGKADLGILTDCAPTAITRARIYSFAEHENILDALISLAETTYGFDFDVVCTTTKTFTTYYPSKGSDTGITWEWTDGASNLVEWSMSTDLSQASGSVSVLGEGTTDSEGRADDREHQWALDAVVHGGRRLELLEQAEARATTSQMRDRAEELVESLACPTSLTLTVHRTDTDDWAADVASGALAVGDTVHVTIDHGPVQVDDDYRIVELELDPVTETIRPALNLSRSLVS